MLTGQEAFPRLHHLKLGKRSSVDLFLTDDNPPDVPLRKWRLQSHTRVKFAEDSIAVPSNSQCSDKQTVSVMDTDESGRTFQVLTSEAAPMKEGGVSPDTVMSAFLMTELERSFGAVRLVKSKSCLIDWKSERRAVLGTSCGTPKVQGLVNLISRWDSM